MREKILLKLCTAPVLWKKKVARAYESLSEKVDDFVVKKLLLSISTDSIKHSILLSALGKIVMKFDVNEELCKAQMGEAWNNIDKMAWGGTTERRHQGRHHFSDQQDDKSREFHGRGAFHSSKLTTYKFDG